MNKEFNKEFMKLSEKDQKSILNLIQFKNMNKETRLKELQQENQQLNDRINKAIDFLNNEYESCKGALTNPEYTIISKHNLLKNEVNNIGKTIKILKGGENNGQ